MSPPSQFWDDRCLYLAFNVDSGELDSPFEPSPLANSSGDSDVIVTLVAETKMY